MSLYRDYVDERLGKSVLEDRDGFAVYYYTKWNGEDAVYIEEIYVAPHARRKGHASKLTDQVVAEAKKEGARTLIGSVYPQARGSTESLRALLAYGMRLAGIDGNLVIFTKDLED